MTFLATLTLANICKSVNLVNDSLEYSDDAICLQSGIYRDSQIDLTTKTSAISIEIVPNPANNYFDIILGKSIEGICKISITNSLQEFVLDDQFNCKQKSHQVNTSHLNPGVYFISIQTNSIDIITKKLVIIK